MVGEGIASGDQVTYAEAEEITGRSHGFLAKQVRLGVLRRDGGHPWDVYTTWLSRSECESLALAQYRRGQPSGYWMTMTQVAELAGISRANVHSARKAGRLLAQRTGLGDWLVGRSDAYLFAMTVSDSTSAAMAGRSRETGEQNGADERPRLE